MLKKDALWCGKPLSFVLLRGFVGAGQGLEGLFRVFAPQEQECESRQRNGIYIRDGYLLA